MWFVKKKQVTPVITGATATFSKMIDKIHEHRIKELQTTAIFGTAHKLREVLM
jgi:hypothetical protein